MAQDSGANLSLPWRTVALVSLILAIVSTGALIVLVAVRGDPVLSSTALTLAILAFVIQIVVFVVQTSVAIRHHHRRAVLAVP